MWFPKDSFDLLNAERTAVTTYDGVGAVGLAEKNVHADQVANCRELPSHVFNGLLYMYCRLIPTSEKETASSLIWKQSGGCGTS